MKTYEKWEKKFHHLFLDERIHVWKRTGYVPYDLQYEPVGHILLSQTFFKQDLK